MATSETRLVAPGGALHVEALDPSIADATLLPGGLLTIHGVRPGDTSVMIVTADDIISWPVHVTPAPRPTYTQFSGAGGWLDLIYQPAPPPAGGDTLALLCENRLLGTPSSLLVACSPPAATGTLTLSFQHGDVDGGLTAGGWHLNVHPEKGIRVAASSYLPTPLQDFGVAPGWGVDARAGGLEVIDTALGADILQHMTIAGGDVFAGVTPMGPLAGAQFSQGPWAAHVTELFSNGQTLAAWGVTYHAGDVTLGYNTGPLGGGFLGRLNRDPLDFVLSVNSSGLQAGVVYDMRNGQTVQATWSSANGFQLALVIPLGSATSRTVVTPGQTQVTVLLTTPTPTPEASVPIGPGSLAVRAAPPGGGSPFVHLTEPLPSPAPPRTPLAPAAPSAILVVRTCIDTRGAGTCGPSDPPILVTVLVDGKPVPASSGGIPISPGQHVVAVEEETIPPLLVPLRGLTCELTIPASGVGTCELPFRRAGSPPAP